MTDRLGSARRFWRMACDGVCQLDAVTVAVGAILDHLEAAEPAPPPIAPDRPDNWQPLYPTIRTLLDLAYAAYSRPLMTPTIDGFCRWLDCGPDLRHLIETTLENP